MTSKTEVDYNKTAGCSSLLLLLLPCPRPAPAPSPPPLHHFALRRLASRQHSLFVHWAAKNFTLTLLSGHQAVCAYFPIPLLQLAPLHCSRSRSCSCSSHNWGQVSVWALLEIYSWLWRLSGRESEIDRQCGGWRRASYAIFGLLTIPLCCCSCWALFSLLSLSFLAVVVLHRRVRNSVNLARNVQKLSALQAAAIKRREQGEERKRAGQRSANQDKEKRAQRRRVFY